MWLLIWAGLKYCTKTEHWAKMTKCTNTHLKKSVQPSKTVSAQTFPCTTDCSADTQTDIMLIDRLASCTRLQSDEISAGYPHDTQSTQRE